MNIFKLMKEKPVVTFLIIALGLILILLLVYLLWLRPMMQSPVSEALNINPDSRFPEWYVQYQPVNQDPVCGDQDELLILLAGIDYRDDDYLYGLADVIRLIHIDFTVPRVNVVAIPRAMLVEVPQERISVEGPILLNQAYFFGTPGMGKYAGSGYGAGALAEIIQYNFNLQADHYLVVDFKGFSQFIDTLGGIEVDLPVAIDAGSAGYFPEGKQTLNGEQALRLARTRKNYSDNVRISNQTLIIQGIFERLKSPNILLRLPQLIADLRETVLTDAAPAQIQDALCLIEKLNRSNLNFFQPDENVMSVGWAFIPSMDKEMNIYTWDERFLSWLHESVYFTE